VRELFANARARGGSEEAGLGAHRLATTTGLQSMKLPGQSF
jgi:hypothetical protein